MLIVYQVDIDDSLARKALDFYEVAEIAEKMGKLDVACSNYFKSLTALNDFVLAKNGLTAKDHNERFALLKKTDYILYKISSSLFLLYRRTYTSQVDREEINELKVKLKEAFVHAGISSS